MLGLAEDQRTRVARPALVQRSGTGDAAANGRDGSRPAGCGDSVRE
jgi:hypothetical protein